MDLYLICNDDYDQTKELRM